MVFDLICYALATVTVLAVIGGNKRSEQRVGRTVSAAKEAIATVNALDLQLPEECFAVDTVAVEVPAPAPVQPVTPAQFDCGNIATVEEWAIVEAAQGAIALRWACDNVVPFVRPTKPVKLVEYRNNKDLRTKCREAGVSPSVGTGKNRRFLTVAEMVQRLGEAGYEVHCVA